ncbi:hypothetical protein RN001_015446 [Aquatica leii]|uniref:Beta-1,4-N-acetylgalactosaminyltransferase n=1 Tax=Aquatica leii TaxID=1421715 RepID=A0AAN7NZ27_9COLE|nr:hypothetical protein RN001_015446 [Aquatica leii]
MRKFSLFVLIILFVVLFHPGRHAKYYDYIQISDVLSEIVPNQQSNLTNCPTGFYHKLLQTATKTKSIHSPSNFTQPKLGGEYEPSDCKAIFEVAVIVPYRNRQTQLQLFLNYMHAFLQQQKLKYRIFVVEQNDAFPFNRAKMLNVGANEAMKMNFPCLILHDVDLFPLNPKNLYACFKKPRHMSSSVDTFRFNLPYLSLFGGVIAIQLEHFKLVNGMSNMFDGWGGEDDDFFTRLKEHNLVPYRLAPELSVYTMLSHKKQPVAIDRWKKLEGSLDRQMVDGLNSIPNNYKVEFEELYTHILV